MKTTSVVIYVDRKKNLKWGHINLENPTRDQAGFYEISEQHEPREVGEKEKNHDCNNSLITFLRHDTEQNWE